MTRTQKICLTMLCLFGAVAFALPSRWNFISNYSRVKGSQEVGIYLAGAGGALLAANSALELNHAKKLYCQPNKLTLGPENYISIFEKRLEDNRDFYNKLIEKIGSDLPIEFVLLDGLKETFPCPEEPQSERRK